jgi:hypothetical protein
MHPDVPCSFFDMSWMAVRDCEVESTMRALALSDPRPVRWVQGMHAVLRDIWDFDDNASPWSRVYVTPRLDGWRLALGMWVGGLGERGTEEIVRSCRELSAMHGRACAFTTQGRMDWYAWTIATDGRIERHYVWNGGLVTDQGTASQQEVALIEVRKAERRALYKEAGIAQADMKGLDWHPNEALVMGLAAAFSFDIDTLGPSTKVEGEGFLCQTAIGRERGASSPVCNCVSMSDRCG